MSEWQSVAMLNHGFGQSVQLFLAQNHDLAPWSTKQGSQHSGKTWKIREKFAKFEKSGKNLENSGKFLGES